MKLPKSGLSCGLMDMACTPSDMALSSQLEFEVGGLHSVGKVHYLGNIHCQLIISNVRLL